MTTLQVCARLKIHKSRLYRLMRRSGVRPWQRIYRGHVVNSYSDGDLSVLHRILAGN